MLHGLEGVQSAAALNTGPATEIWCIYGCGDDLAPVQADRRRTRRNYIQPSGGGIVDSILSDEFGNMGNLVDDAGTSPDHGLAAARRIPDHPQTR